MLTYGKGFTLVELLVVLLILSLLLVAVPIAYDRVLPGLQLRSEAQEIARILREARTLAIQENRDVTVSIDVEERSLGTAGHGAGHRISAWRRHRIVVATSRTLSSMARVSTVPKDASASLWTAGRTPC